MGALPKIRISRTRRNRRRAHYLRLKLPNMLRCQCGALHISHRVCAKCGKYNGRQVVTLKEESAT